MRDSIADQIRALAADVFELSSAQAADDASPATIQTWDSLRHLNFVLALESRFGVQFDPAEIEQIGSIKQAIDLVERKKHKESGG